MKVLVPVLLGLVGLPGNGVLPEARAAFERPGRPTWVLLGPRATLARQASRIQALHQADDLLDLGIAGCEVQEDQPDHQDLAAWLRLHLGLPPASHGSVAWGLVGREGQTLTAGQGLPDAEDLRAALESAGERNPVRVLSAFLAERPEHAEARRDLVRALRPRLQARLAAYPIPLGQDHPPERDAQIWAPMAQELDLLFKGEDWAHLGFSLDRELPEGAPEQSSPLMKAVYRKHASRVAAGLQRYPENPSPWLNLLRLDRVLDEHHLEETLNHVTWFRVRPVEAALMPYGALAQRLHKEALRTGHWRAAMVAEKGLWTHLAKPKVDFHGKETLLAPEASAEDRRRWGQAEREEIWAQVLAPLIEAMVRSGNEADVLPLLGDLDERWKSLGLEERLTRLARAVERGDLAQPWVARVQGASPSLPTAGFPGEERVLVHAGRPALAEQEVESFEQVFHQHGILLGLQAAPPAWVQRLGWIGTAPHWALVSRQGQVLMQGQTLPRAEELLARYQGRGLPLDLEEVTTFRQAHPEHLGALALEVQLRGLAAWAHSSARLGRSLPEELVGEEEQAAWRDYRDVLERLLDDPLGSLPGLMRTAQVHIPVPGELGQHAGRLDLDSLAGRILPGLEGRLARRPSDLDLWSLWLALAPHSDRPVAPFMDRLAPSPLTPSSAWPPQEILAAASGSLCSLERWQDLSDLLQPRWQARKMAVEAHRQGKDPAARHGFALGWSWALTRPLLESLLHLGRIQEADEVMDALTLAGDLPGPAERSSLGQRARALGAKAWARRWCD